MKIKVVLVLGILSFLIFINAGLIFSQEATEQEGTIPQTQSEPDIQWLWGEAISLDAQNKTILVKYLDYETDQDQEKEVTINVDDKTTYENIKSIDELKPKDVLSIDYIVIDEKNIAKNISVEKPENTQETQEENMQQESEVSPPVIESAPQTINSTQ